MKTRISITDDHPLFVDGLNSILSNSDNVDVAFTTTSGIKLIEELSKGAMIDIAFLDLDMPEMDGLETLKIIKRDFPNLHVLILSMHYDETIILHLIENGVSGYLLKNSSVKKLEAAIDGVMKHGLYFEDFVVEIMLNRMAIKRNRAMNFGNGTSISNREMEVLELLCKGFNSREIAEKLFVSSRTIEGHKKKLMEKTNSRNTAGIIVNSLKLQLIQLENL